MRPPRAVSVPGRELLEENSEASQGQELSNENEEQGGMGGEAPCSQVDLTEENSQWQPAWPPVPSTVSEESSENTPQTLTEEQLQPDQQPVVENRSTAARGRPRKSARVSKKTVSFDMDNMTEPVKRGRKRGAPKAAKTMVPKTQSRRTTMRKGRPPSNAMVDIEVETQTPADGHHQMIDDDFSMASDALRKWVKQAQLVGVMAANLQKTVQPPGVFFVPVLPADLLPGEQRIAMDILQQQMEQARDEARAVVSDVEDSDTE